MWLVVLLLSSQTPATVRFLVDCHCIRTRLFAEGKAYAILGYDGASRSEIRSSFAGSVGV